MKKIPLILIIIIIFCCSGNKSYQVRGTIIEIRKNQNKLIIHHDEIPEFMMAMTMPFTLIDSMDINRFEVGDSVKFRLIIKNANAVADDFELLGRGTLPEYDDMWDNEYAPIDIGEILSDVKLFDIDSNEVTLSDSDGKFRLISYIFTRCPMPNMCPAVVVKNQYLAQEFKDVNNIEFILISFDYIYDTPSVLKKTYGSLLESNTNLKVYSSTGHINDIFSLAGQSFISFWGVNENDIGHSLRSVFIDPERRLMKAFEGTDWRPEISELDIKNIMKAYNL